jgi:hypothetical protein
MKRRASVAVGADGLRWTATDCFQRKAQFFRCPWLFKSISPPLFVAFFKNGRCRCVTQSTMKYEMEIKGDAIAELRELPEDTRREIGYR